MKKTKATNAFMLGLVSVVLLSGGISYYFYQQMSGQFVLISQGFEPTTQILDNYLYDRYQKGLIIALTIMVASAFFLVMVLIPEEEAKRAEPMDMRMHEQMGMEMSGPPSGLSAEIRPEGSAMAEEMEQVQAEPVIDSIDSEGLDLFDDGFQEVTEGEDDVVYGSEPITNAAIIDFVHKNPDSALKFLFRKQLDGKGLTTDEEEIYHSWEQRGMTRGKVKAYILSMMEWDVLPKEPLYEIWKKLRDHIFENYG